MFSHVPKSSASPKTRDSFLAEWSERKLPSYVDEYGGERAGVPKGEDIPFLPRKVKAAVALLAYGAPKHETLAAIARTVRVSSALLRVWRTEKRFLALYRRALWECSDEYIRLLAANWVFRRPSPEKEFRLFFGVALQQTILRCLCVDVLHMVPEWTPFALKPKWLSECTLVGPPRKAPPSFSKDETRHLKANTHMLLSSSLLHRRTPDPGLAHWAARMLLRNFSMEAFIKNDLRTAVDKGNKEDALSFINFITSRPTFDDWEELQRLVSFSKTGKRTR